MIKNKTLLAILTVISFYSLAYAYQETVYKVDFSSFTNTPDSNVRISSSNVGDILVSVFVGKCGTTNPGSLFTVWDSTGQTGNDAKIKLFEIDTSTSGADSCSALGAHEFFIPLTKGINYTNTGGASVQIGYFNRRLK